jgi:hypothetical protein
MSLVTGVSFVMSLVRASIWRGMGLDPVIHRTEQPLEYFSSLALLASLTAIFFGGALWLLVATRIKR